MLLVSVGFCAGAAFYRFALESVVLKKRRKEREVDRVARRSVTLREGKDAIDGETYVQCKGGEGEDVVVSLFPPPPLSTNMASSNICSYFTRSSRYKILLCCCCFYDGLCFEKKNTSTRAAVVKTNKN